MKRFLEAGYRNGSPLGYSELLPRKGHIRTSRHTGTEPNVTPERMQGDPQASILHIIPGLDGSPNTPEEPNHAPV